MKDLDGDLFKVPFPLGEILYEKNEVDPNLHNINTVPEYINFVNEIQQTLFNGTSI